MLFEETTGFMLLRLWTLKVVGRRTYIRRIDANIEAKNECNGDGAHTLATFTSHIPK